MDDRLALGDLPAFAVNRDKYRFVERVGQQGRQLLFAPATGVAGLPPLETGVQRRAAGSHLVIVLVIRHIGVLSCDYRNMSALYGSPEISGHECRFDLGHVIGASYRMGEAGAQGTAQSERIRPWLVANRFQAISQASMMSARLINTVLASQWLRR